MDLKCPKCGEPYNPKKNQCEHCGSYIIESEEKSVDLPEINVEEYSGVYVFGKLLGKGERPIRLGWANYFTGIISAGGKLLLTNRNLYFKAHQVNIGRRECTIDLNDIRDIKLALNLLISQHIVIYTKSDSHRFVVYHGQEWIDAIKTAMDFEHTIPMVQ